MIKTPGWRKRLHRITARAALSLVALFAANAASAYDWLQFGGNAQHNGLNTVETLLTRANIGSLAQKYQVTLAGVADGAPVFLQAVTTASGTKDLLFVTTKDGRIIALDAQTGTVVWSHVDGPGTCTINSGGSSPCYTTSSPAIDPNRAYVYSYGLDGFVHKYQVGTGTEITSGGWPAVTTLKGYDEKGSSALGIATSGGVTRLYVTHGGYPGDNGDYQGHVTAINLATGAQTVFNAACSDKTVHLDHYSGTLTANTCATVQDAIWSRPGIVYDPGTDLIFIGTGNAFTVGKGRFDGVHNWSESVLALHPDASGGTGIDAGKPFDSYTPSNWSPLDDSDADVGSTGPTILPVPAASLLQHLGVQSGKDGMVRLLNLDDLSGMGGPGNLGGSVGAPIAIPQGGNLFAQPAVWINPADSSTWIFIVNSSGASGLRLNIDGGGNPSLAAQWTNSGTTPGTSPIVANNMLFFISSSNVRVLDPATGATLRLVSGTGAPHWQSLIVANGVVYATDGSSHLTAFAPTSSSTPTTTTLTSATNPANAGANVTLTAAVNGATPTGTVAFADGVTPIAGCTAATLVAGSPPKATCTTSALSVGTHSIVATYSGDANNAGSSSSALLQQINVSGETNLALASAGGVATASSTFSAQYPVVAINDNDRTGAAWANGGGWNDATANVFPDWVQIKFNGNKTIDRVVVYTLQDNYANPIEPTDALTFSTYGITDFVVQGWNGSAWVQLGAAVSSNHLVKRTITFTPYSTDRIRINITNAPLQYSRVVEVEAWGVAAVGPPPSTTTVTSSLNPSTVGASVTFTATVAGTVPTGTVSFTSDGTTISGCGAVALSGSGNSKTASCATGGLTAATHAIVASYTGDGGNAASSSASLSQVVNASGSINVALSTNGGVATASTTYSNAYPIAAINNNERAGLNWGNGAGNGGGWNDATISAWPDWVQIKFSGTKTINRIVVYTLQDSYMSPVEPTDTMTFTQYGITSFTVAGKQGSKWVTLATVTGNNLVKRTVTFAPLAVSQIRIQVNAALASFSRITEVEAWGN